MNDKQCSSCGGFCGRGGCKRENVNSWEQMQRMATPHDQLITELLDSRIPKTEREHAAAREIKKLREALAEPEQEPVAWMMVNEEHGHKPTLHWKPQEDWHITWKVVPLYAAPPARKPLTDEEIDAEFDRECWVTVVFADGTKGIALDKVTARDFARAIERAHGIGEA